MAFNGEPREPTGSLVDRPEGPTIQIQRSLPHPQEDVWSHLVDPELLRWYGTYTGDPDSGSVQLIRAEAPDQPVECTIELCERPSQLHVTLHHPAGTDRRVQVSLDRDLDASGTDLILRAPLPGNAEQAGDLGPTWEYYLDRLSVALEGGDMDEVDFADFHPGQKDNYTPEARPARQTGLG
ncbi:hypothetical protein [Citricoccus sp. GCM10030269]|uniref:hypothetical protein n=1 Tax=Citricoccus sp. GCM10030269 TaxID=3273388 RepID=UPI003621538F